MTTSADIAGTRLTLLRGDITQQATEAIVNAANSSLLGGGGVDGAIHRAGGPGILQECKKIVMEIGRCPAGEAVITAGGDLEAAWVIHTVGPVWRSGGHGEAGLLASAYRNSLNLAAARGIRSLSFPSISTGAYRFPTAQAAEIALGTVCEVLEQTSFDELRFVLFSEADLTVYKDTISKLFEHGGRNVALPPIAPRATTRWFDDPAGHGVYSRHESLPRRRLSCGHRNYGLLHGAWVHRISSR